MSSKPKDDLRTFIVGGGSVIIILVGFLMLTLRGAHGAKDFPWDEIYKETAIALIGGGAVTFLIRLAIDEKLEGSLVESVELVTASHITGFKDVLRDHIRGRTEFDASETYTNRSVHADFVERDVCSLLAGSESYTSFGLSGQYAVTRLSEFEHVSSTCRIRIIMAAPASIHLGVFADADVIKTRIAGCAQSLVKLAEEKSLDLEILFAPPVPSLRFDIIGNETFVYAFDNRHKSDAGPPDAARYAYDSQWGRSARQMAVDASRAASAGWQRGTGAWIADSPTVRKSIEAASPSQQIAQLLQSLGLKPLTEEELKAFVDKLREDQQRSGDRTFASEQRPMAQGAKVAA